MKKSREILERLGCSVFSNVNLQPLEDKRILVTGASGLIGRTVIEALRYVSGSFVNAIDRRGVVPGDSNILSWRSLDDVAGNYDYVIYAAGAASPAIFTADPVETFKVNTEGVFKAARMLLKGGTLLYLSSSEIYEGCNEQVPSEYDVGRIAPQHPRATYINGKRAGEAICYALRTQGFKVRVARVCSAYGPGCAVSDSRVVNQLINRALSTGEVALKDKGEAVRRFCFISDMAEMLFNIMLYGKEITYNATSRDQASINTIGKIIALRTGSPFREGNEPVRGAPSRATPSIQRYAHEFPNQKFMDLQEGIGRTVDWYEAIRSEISDC